MQIRQATVEDVDAIEAVIAPFVDDVICSEEGRDRFQPDILKTIFDRSDIHYFVAEIGNKVIGILTQKWGIHFIPMRKND